MGRPSIKAERTQEILDAYERCVSRFGVEGSTLEKIAEEAGLRRSSLRHYIGNKDDLLEALVTRFITKSRQSTEELMSCLTAGMDAASLVETLFDESSRDQSLALVAGALIVAGTEYPDVAASLITWIDEFNDGFAKRLRKIWPQCKLRDCQIVATGIIGIYFNVESFSSLGSTEKLNKRSKDAALRLALSLS
ncbi:MAG: TetR family transcriptional regulator [Gammaproteobacteria bacterium]|nr:TetR family transcriptional regulator [Gammaproteobacteria bacterium]